MSRSRRIQANPTTGTRPNRFKAAFLDSAGELRSGWVPLLCAAGWLSITLGVRLGLTAAFDGLFDAWCIDASNAQLAPAWARLVYAWHGSAITAVTALAVIALALGLRRMLRLPAFPLGRVKDGGRMALVGLIGALLLAALFLMADSLRLEWPLTRPHLSAGLPALLAISLLSTLAGELLTKKVLFDALAPRRGAVWAALAATLLFFLGSGGYGGGVVGAVNTLLLGAMCCLVYHRTDNLWAPAGLRWGWSAANLFLLGFGGGDSAIYRLYGVSEQALTGGDAGLMVGLGATVLLMAGLAWLEREAVSEALDRIRRRKRVQ